MHVQTRTRAHTHTHARARTHTQTHIHTSKHTHMHAHFDRLTKKSGTNLENRNLATKKTKQWYMQQMLCKENWHTTDLQQNSKSKSTTRMICTTRTKTTNKRAICKYAPCNKKHVHWTHDTLPPPPSRRAQRAAAEATLCHHELEELDLAGETTSVPETQSSNSREHRSYDLFLIHSSILCSKSNKNWLLSQLLLPFSSELQWEASKTNLSNWPLTKYENCAFLKASNHGP